jgi:hypothetical protein
MHFLPQPNSWGVAKHNLNGRERTWAYGFKHLCYLQNVDFCNHIVNVGLVGLYPANYRMNQKFIKAHNIHVIVRLVPLRRNSSITLYKMQCFLWGADKSSASKYKFTGYEIGKFITIITRSTTNSCPESDESSPHPHILFLKIIHFKFFLHLIYKFSPKKFLYL